MSHEITIRKDGQAEFFAGSSTPAWHQLGTVISGLATRDEALPLSKTDWEVELQKKYLENGKMIPNSYAIVRKDNGNILGECKGRYHIIQNSEVAEFAESLVGTGLAMFDAGGSLKGGKKVFYTLKVDRKFFLNDKDEIVHYIIVVSSHDESQALYAIDTSVRVVCQNTVNLAFNSNRNIIKIRHVKNFQDRLREAQKVLGLSNGYFNDLESVMKSLTEEPFNDLEMVRFAQTLFPEAENASANKRREEVRDTLFHLFKSGRGNNGRTKFDAFNAVTEYVDHFAEVKGKSKLESRFISSLMNNGNALRNKAANLLIGV